MAFAHVVLLALGLLARSVVVLALPVEPVFVPIFTSHDTPSMRPSSRSGPEPPNPTTVTSCGQWISIYERHWQKYPDCHRGKTNRLCCQLYDLMDKSIRIFKQELKCEVTNMAFFQKKFSSFCVNGGSSTSHASTPAGTVVTGSSETTSITLRPPVTIGDSHGKIIILEEESTHTGQVCTSGTCCTGQSCFCESCTATTTTTTTTCTSTSCGCVGQHCTKPCQGTHCGTPCTGVHCNTGCTGTNCNVVQQPQQQPVQPVAPVANVCQAGVNCAGVCVNNQCVGVTQNTDDNGNVCFHPQTTVQLASGQVKPMHKLNIGDHVHVGFGKYSRVFMFTHNDASIPATFMNVTVRSGESIMLTPSHFIYLKGGLMQAAHIKSGTVIQMHDGRYESVVHANRVHGFGLYNPQTMHGDIAVSGFRASTYTTAIPSSTAHALLAPLRVLYRICGAHISAVF